MLNNLYLDMVLDSCNFILFDEDRNIIDEFSIKTKNNLIDNVVHLLNSFLSKNKIEYKNLNNLYINIGPGSFTGTKAIVNITKTIKLVFNHINIYTITNDLVFNNGNGISIIDAKSKKYFISVYENKNNLVELNIYNEDEKEMIINQYSYLNIFNEENTNSEERARNIISNLDLFTECKNYLELEPKYIKSALNN